MNRIIAFDGLDRSGKTTIINNLSEELIKENYIPYVFHLTGPNDEYNEIFTYNRVW